MKPTVQRTITAFNVDMGGLAVKQVLPAHNVTQIDPFLLLHHTGVPVRAGTHPLQAGVPPHPHRGFSAVTLVVDGEVHHRDSLGNSSVIGKGGVQWVHAARGIVHSERPSAALASAGGVMEVIQLWVNSPSAKKMSAATYHALEAAEIPKVVLGDLAELHLIAGSYAGVDGKIKPQSPMLIARIYAKSGASFQLEFAPKFNTAIYLLSGKGTIEGHGMVEAMHLYHLVSGVANVNIHVNEDVDILILSGEPINEPLATHGPFVMNNQTQIMEAMRDYQAGKMGILIEE
jgi:hypothetical protein